MSRSIWVLVEHWRGEVSEVTYELLALGRELASDLNAELEAVLLGHDCRQLAGNLGVADAVLYVDHLMLAEATPQGRVQALGQLVNEKKPVGLLAPLTNISWDIGGLLAEHLSTSPEDETPFVNFCQAVHVVDGALQARCLVYGGKMEATVTPMRSPAVFGVLPGVRSAEQGRSSTPAKVNDVIMNLPDDTCVRFKQYLEPETGDVDVTQQDVLVAIGRGIQGEMNIELAEELAEALGGAVCGSRPVIDQGWLPLSRQIGKSGASVKPKLYLTAGISGAPEHVEGMKSSSLIVAINTDPQAPIFNIAHYGIVGDALEFLPALTEAIKGRKS